MISLITKIFKLLVFISWLFIWILGTIPILFLYFMPISMFIKSKIKGFIWICMNQYAILISLPIFKKRKISFYGDEINVNKKSNILFMINHQSTVDILVTTLVADKAKLLPYIRYLSKTFNLLLPICGYVYNLIGFVQLSRQNRTIDLTRIKEAINRALCWNENILYILYPEGTRMDPNNNKLRSSSSKFLMEKFSKDTSYVLAPRISGYRALLEGMKNDLHEVWDITLCYTGKPPYPNSIPSVSIFDYMMNSSIEVHVYVKRWKYEDLKLLPEDCSYLYDWYFQKDALIKKFYNNGLNSFDNHRKTYEVSHSEYIFHGLFIPLAFIIYVIWFGLIKCLKFMGIVSIFTYIGQAIILNT